MPQLETSLRARFFFVDLETEGLCGFPEDSEKEECIRRLTEAIEDAESHAKNEGFEKMMDSAHENASLRLQLEDAENTIRCLKMRIAELED